MACSLCQLLGLCPSVPGSVPLGGYWGLAPCWIMFLRLLVAGVGQGMWTASLRAAPGGATELGGIR